MNVSYYCKLSMKMCTFTAIPLTSVPREPPDTNVLGTESVLVSQTCTSETGISNSLLAIWKTWGVTKSLYFSTWKLILPVCKINVCTGFSVAHFMTHNVKWDKVICSKYRPPKTDILDFGPFPVFFLSFLEGYRSESFFFAWSTLYIKK